MISPEGMKKVASLNMRGKNRRNIKTASVTIEGRNGKRNNLSGEGSTLLQQYTDRAPDKGSESISRVSPR